MLQLFEDFRLGIVRRNMVIKNVDSDDKWTFGLNLCEYLLYAIHRPYEIEPCPQYIYHFVLPVHQPSFFLSKENLEMYCESLSNTCQIRLRAHLILFDPILVKHHQHSVCCLGLHVKQIKTNRCTVLFEPCTKDIFVFRKNLILAMSNNCQIYQNYLSSHHNVSVFRGRWFKM